DSQQQHIRNHERQRQRVVPRPQSCKRSRPRLRHSQKRLRAPHSIALQSHIQPVRRVLRLESALLPSERPVRPVRSAVRIRFLCQKFPRRQIDSQLAARKFCRDCLCLRSIHQRRRSRLGNLVVVPHYLSCWIHSNVKFFLLLWLEKPHFPIPDVQLRTHQQVRL